MRSAWLWLALAVVPATASAQAMRTYAASRPVAAPRVPLRVTLDFGAGRVAVQAGDSTELYGVLMNYDADRFTPVQRYDPRTGIAHLGLEPVGHGGLRVTSWEHLDQAARFTLAPTVPLHLDASLGASEAAIDLARLALRTLTIRSGATRGTIDVSAPTSGRCERATFSSGAGELRVLHFANAGCDEIHIEGGAGRTVLDLSGAWRGDTRLSASLAVGALVIRVPRGVGVQVRATDRFLARVAARDLVQRGAVRESADFAAAPHHLTIELTANVADVQVEWLEKGTN